MEQLANTLLEIIDKLPDTSGNTVPIICLVVLFLFALGVIAICIPRTICEIGNIFLVLLAFISEWFGKSSPDVDKNGLKIKGNSARKGPKNSTHSNSAMTTDAPKKSSGKREDFGKKCIPIRARIPNKVTPPASQEVKDLEGHEKSLKQKFQNLFARIFK